MAGGEELLFFGDLWGICSSGDLGHLAEGKGTFLGSICFLASGGWLLSLMLFLCAGLFGVSD